MKFRFLWLLIFVALNIVIILSMGAYYQWVPVSQWSVLSYYLVLMAMLLLGGVLYIMVFLSREQDESDVERDSLRDTALRRAERAILDHDGDRVYEGAIAEPQWEDDRPELEPITGSGSKQTGEEVSPLGAKPEAEEQIDGIQSGGDTVTGEVPEEGAVRVADPGEVVVGRYTSPEIQSGCSVKTYVAGAFIPGSLMDHDPGELGTHFQLSREPDNPWDPHTIRVREQSGNRIGFIPRPVNRTLASFMDQGQEFEVTLAAKRQICQSLRMDVEIRPRDN